MPKHLTAKTPTTAPKGRFLSDGIGFLLARVVVRAATRAAVLSGLGAQVGFGGRDVTARPRKGSTSMSARPTRRRPAESRSAHASSERAWDALVRDLRTRVHEYAPDWTNQPGGDPGITLLELMAFLGESLLARTVPSSRAVGRLRDIVKDLERAAGPSCADLPNPTRPRYFAGQLVSAADLAQEQEYHRAARRRHNLVLHGTGIVSGLDVAVEADGPAGAPVVSVTPGVAIDPAGEELVVCDPMTAKVTPTTSSVLVVLRLVDRPHSLVPTPGGDEPTRIEEVVEVDVVGGDVPPGEAPSGLAIARLIRRHTGWQVDPTFRASRSSEWPASE